MGTRQKSTIPRITNEERMQCNIQCQNKDAERKWKLPRALKDN